MLYYKKVKIMDNFGEIKKLLKKRESQTIISLITIVIAIIGIFSVQPNINDYGDMSVSDSENVIQTQGQNGDNIINTEKPVRHLEGEMRTKFENKLKQMNSNKVRLVYIPNDSEAYNFAKEVVNYLESNGYKVSWDALLTVNKEPFVKQSIELIGDTIQIEIGENV